MIQVGDQDFEFERHVTVYLSLQFLFFSSSLLHTCFFNIICVHAGSGDISITIQELFALCLKQDVLMGLKLIMR